MSKLVLELEYDFDFTLIGVQSGRFPNLDLSTVHKSCASEPGIVAAININPIKMLKAII